MPDKLPDLNKIEMPEPAPAEKAAELVLERHQGAPSDVPDEMFALWPGWAYHNDLDVAKFTEVLDELAAFARTPYLFLTAVAAAFRSTSDAGKAVERLPDLPPSLKTPLLAFVTRMAEWSPTVTGMVLDIAKANIDAFLELVGGPRAPLNRIRIQAEHQDDKEKAPFKNGATLKVVRDGNGRPLKKKRA